MNINDTITAILIRTAVEEFGKKDSISYQSCLKLQSFVEGQNSNVLLAIRDEGIKFVSRFAHDELSKRNVNY
jgi:hypothetical protein